MTLTGILNALFIWQGVAAPLMVIFYIGELLLGVPDSLLDEEYTSCISYLQANRNFEKVQNFSSENPIRNCFLN
jgi:hypothetical protein